MIERTEPARDADEKTMLCGWMDYHRATIITKLEGLDDTLLRKRLVPSETTLLGIVKHLAQAEHYWFTQIFDTGQVEPPWPNDLETWRVADDETTDGIVRHYIDTCDRSRRIIAAASLDDRATWEPRSHVTLRWILTHMIEETARHNGHADILREQLDGVTGE